MNQQPDKLFREKLEGYNRPAPTGAWDKIDAGLQKKNNKGPGLVWKVAASLLLIALVGYGVWPTANEQPKPIAKKQDAENKHAKGQETNTVPAPDEKSTSPLQPDLPSKEIHHTAKHNKVEETEKPKEELIEQPVEEKLTPSLEVENPIAQTNEKVIEELPVTQTEKSEAVAINTSTPARTTLIITAKEADEYLNKKELAQATSKEKKSSTLKKLLKKADDLTNDQDPFGELRQKKNEILALNFKTEKQRGQNK